ncbi:MAG TPA: hypothetical protein GXZ27_07395, partial [Thermoanaerobacterales bacterium]|nr:hypothetical protein [Thermoanaerobacterales bacterium]
RSKIALTRDKSGRGSVQQKTALPGTNAAGIVCRPYAEGYSTGRRIAASPCVVQDHIGNGL